MNLKKLQKQKNCKMQLFKKCAKFYHKQNFQVLCVFQVGQTSLQHPKRHFYITNTLRIILI